MPIFRHLLSAVAREIDFQAEAALRVILTPWSDLLAAAAAARRAAAGGGVAGRVVLDLVVILIFLLISC
jgi:hypothetical protein